MHELGLITSKVITIEQQREGKTERKLLEGLWVVDEEKLRGIDDARIVEIFRNGYMGWVYAHLLSLGNLRRLATRLDRASRVTGDSMLESKPADDEAGESGRGGNGSSPGKAAPKGRGK